MGTKLKYGASVDPAGRTVRSARNTRRLADDIDVQKWLEVLGISLVVAVTLWMFRIFIMPAAMAGVFASIVWPLRHLLVRRKFGRNSVALILTTSFVLVFLVPFVGLTILAARSILRNIQEAQLANRIGSVEDLAQMIGATDLVKWFDRIEGMLPFSREQMQVYVLRGVQNVLTALASLLQSFFANIPSFAMGNIILVGTLFFLLRDGHTIGVRLRHFTPFSESLSRRLFPYMAQLCQAVIIAALAAGGVQASLAALTSVLTAVGDPLLVGFAVFVTSFIPIVGSVPLWIVFVGYCLVNGMFAQCMIFFGAAIASGVADNIVRPLVMQGGASLHPMIAFLAALGGLQVFGFYGIFIGPILAGVCFFLLEEKWLARNTTG